MTSQCRTSSALPPYACVTSDDLDNYYWRERMACECTLFGFDEAIRLQRAVNMNQGNTTAFDTYS